MLAAIEEGGVRIRLGHVSVQHHLMVRLPGKNGDMGGEGAAVGSGDQNGEGIGLDEGDGVRVIANAA